MPVIAPQVLDETSTNGTKVEIRYKTDRARGPIRHFSCFRFYLMKLSGRTFSNKIVIDHNLLSLPIIPRFFTFALNFITTCKNTFIKFDFRDIQKILGTSETRTTLILLALITILTLLDDGLVNLFQI